MFLKYQMVKRFKFLIFCMVNFYGLGISYSAEVYDSFHQASHTIYYCSNNPCQNVSTFTCNPGEYKCYDNFVGFKSQNNIDDPRIGCYGQTSCTLPADLTLGVSLLTTLSDTFKIYIPAGAKKTSLVLFGMTTGAAIATVSRFGEPPDCEIPANYSGVPHNLTGATISDLKTGCQFAVNAGGTLTVVTNAYYPTLTEGGWLYIKVLKYSPCNVTDYEYGAVYNVSTYRQWYNSAKWLSNGDPDVPATSNPALSISPTNMDVTKYAGTTASGVSNTGTGTMPWTAQVVSGGSWLQIQSGSSGTGAGTITCQYTANTDTSTRTGTIRVTADGALGSPQDLTVTQAGLLTGSLAAGFAGSGIWVYGSDNTTWIQISSETPQNLTYFGSTLYADFAASGIWKWDGTTWNQLSSIDPESISISGSILYGDFAALGLWKWDGTTWNRLSSVDPESMATSGTMLYANFGSSYGLWKWDGNAWSQLKTDTPEKMVTSGSMLYADFGSSYGLWKWDGTAWSQLSSANPENMVTSGSTLYADFGSSYGLWKWDGTAWSQLSSANPENMVISGSTLNADFGSSYGLWKWDGNAWSQLSSANPENLVATSTTFYADFKDYGIWKWDGSSWSQITGYNPVIMSISN
jgi:hypothetical protein